MKKLIDTAIDATAKRIAKRRKPSPRGYIAITDETHAILKQRATARGVSMSQILDEALYWLPPVAVAPVQPKPADGRAGRRRA